MIINQRMIDFYGEANLLNKLNSNSFYTSWNGLGIILCDRINRHERNDININQIVECDAIEQLIYKLLTTGKSSSLSPSVINKIADIYYVAFEKYPQIVYDSILFSQNVVDKIFNNQQLQKINEYKNKYLDSAEKDFFNAIRSPGNKVSDKLILFAEYQLLHNYEKDSPRKVVDAIFDYIINNPNQNNELYHKEFIARYTAFKSVQNLWNKDNISTVNLYISDRELSKDMTKNTPTSWNGCSYANTGIIFLSRMFLDKNITKGFSTNTTTTKLSHLSSIIAVSAHETKHSSQAYKVQNGILDRCSFDALLRSLFDAYYSGEYIKNYDFSEIETDSNVYGFSFARDLLKGHFPNKHDDIRVSETIAILMEYRQYAGTKVFPGTKKRCTRERYNTKLLDNIISNHPDACEKFPALKFIYDERGKRRSFTDLVRIENDLPNESKAILYDYFLTDIEDNFINDIDLGSYTPEEQIMIVKKVLNVFMEEERRMSKTIKGYEFFSDAKLINASDEAKKKIIDFRHREFQYVNSHRATVMKNCFAFLNKNKHIIDRLRVESINAGQPLAIFTVLPNVVDDLRGHVTKLEKYGIDAASDIADVLKSLDSLEYTGVNNFTY